MGGVFRRPVTISKLSVPTMTPQRQWCVHLEAFELNCSNCYLTVGWDKVVNDLGIEDNDIVTFHVVGDKTSVLYITVYDSRTSEVKDVARANDAEGDEEDEDVYEEDDEEDEDEDDDHDDEEEEEEEEEMDYDDDDDNDDGDGDDVEMDMECGSDDTDDDDDGQVAYVRDYHSDSGYDDDCDSLENYAARP